MSAIAVRPLAEDLPFGARLTGVTEAALSDSDVRQQINQVFEQSGMIVFEEMTPSIRMQTLLSEVFGPLKQHPSSRVARVDPENYPGVIEIAATPSMCIVEIDGKPLITWQPWHFDHCYNDALNRGGILRAIDIAPEDGLTSFADGIQIYDALPSDIREKLERINIIYTLDLLYSHQRFGLPESFRELKPHDNEEGILAEARKFPRAIHPAVWTRRSGEKVVHLGPYMAVGIEGMENAEGDDLFREVWDAVTQVMRPYRHRWKPTDMVIWDNWRMLHEAGGCDPNHARVMHRTTIEGDYGLGRFELAGAGGRRETANAS